jgi:hypothetical protein
MKRVVLVSLGLFLVAGYVGCLPADDGGVVTTGKGGNGQGQAGTSGQAGDNGQGQAGTVGQGGDTAGDAGTTGSGGSVSTAGTTGQAGNGQGQAGTGGNGQGQAGTGGMAGNGMAGMGGRGGMAGTGVGGSAAGTTGRGGTTGAAGSAAGTTGRGGTTGAAGTTGMAGTTGRGGTTGAGGAGNVAGVLDGVMMTGPCLRDTEPSVCATVSGNCPNTGISDIALRGVLTTDKTVTLGGDPATTYTIVLHVQGEVESKNYTNGTDQNSSLTSPRADGWRGHNGGANPVPQTNNAYNVYMLRVTDPGATARDFFLNSLEPPGVENHTTYGIDYTTPAAGSPGALTAKGGATIRVVAADSNCSMIKNCGPSVSGSTCLSPIILQNIEPTAVSKNPSFNFSNAYNGQWIVLTVKSVTP